MIPSFDQFQYVNHAETKAESYLKGCIFYLKRHCHSNLYLRLPEVKIEVTHFLL